MGDDHDTWIESLLAMPPEDHIVVELAPLAERLRELVELRTACAASKLSPSVAVHAVGCDICGRPYGNEHGFPDLVITQDAWNRISPSGDGGGLLCPSCICKRLFDAGMREVEGAFMSGPIKSVDSSLMHTIRWVETLRGRQS